jgi:hypothetical protein
MSESIKKITVEKDINIGVYFTNVDANISRINQIFTSNGDSFPVTGPWNQLFKEEEESYGLIGNDNEIIELLEKIDGSYFRRKPLSTEYEFLTEEESKNVIKGKKYSINYEDSVLDENQINAKSFFKREGDAVSGSSSYTGVFFKKEKKQDYNVDISLIRSVDTLDTLSVKNNPLSEFPNQESSTGVVMGTLYARQKLIDENGERIKIPLGNVPVVIFNPSDKFPTTSSTDDDGNRISLNILENSNRWDYSDEHSWVTDVGSKAAKKYQGNLNSEGIENVNPILKGVNSLNVPEQYLYSTITDQNGEFIIENVPTGDRILMFEVDLLKQGMTKDEVRLNFFPYPTSTSPNVDSVPHFYFRQIPVGVGPSWGSFQTGYTQVDIVANVDMRKWSTYYISPISRNQENLSELLAGGDFQSLNVLVKDMTKEGYPLTNELVEVLDIYSRDETERVGWSTEVKTSKYKAQYRGDGFQAFKLPANLYDPNGRASLNSERKSLSNKKGVWLSCYEMKMLYGGDVETPLYRATGFIRRAITARADFQQKSSHFDINRGPGNSIADATGEPPGSSSNVFPYERPWTINYPNKYKIPRTPKVSTKNRDQNIKLQPRYVDGDMPGLFVYPDEDDNVGHGYSSMKGFESGESIFNRFGTVITRYRIYKYEQGSRWDDEWSNGFRPKYHQDSFTENYTIKDGERYQRVESGFSYWLKPEGWGRIDSRSWGDIMLESDINSKYTPPADSGELRFIPKTYLDSGMFRKGEQIWLSLDSTLPIWLRAGSLDIYRVIDDTVDDLIVPRPPEVFKYFKLNVGDVLAGVDKENKDKTKLRIRTDKNNSTQFATAMKVYIRNDGSIQRAVKVNGTSKDVEVGKSVEFPIATGGIIEFQTNSLFDELENTYNDCKYQIYFETGEMKKVGLKKSNYYSFVLGGFPKAEVPTYYIRSSIANSQSSVNIYTSGKKKNQFQKCDNDHNNTSTHYINGVLVVQSNSAPTFEINSSKYSAASTFASCSNGGYVVFRTVTAPSE